MTSSVNFSSLCSVSGGSGSSATEAVAITPQSRPSTMIGQPTADRYPTGRARSPRGPLTLEKSSIRAAAPVRNTRAVTFSPSGTQRRPIGSATSTSLHAATVVTSPSGSYRPIAAVLTGSSRATSSTSAPNSSPVGAPCATRVATRRSAACSSASRRTSARASAFATAVPISSVNRPRRDSVSGGRGSSCVEPAVITPHSLPSTRTGAPSTARAPDHDRAAVAVEAHHPDPLRAQESPDLFRNRAEHHRLGNLLRDQRRQAAKRSLFALAAASLRDVAPNAIHHAVLGDGRHAPLAPLV